MGEVVIFPARVGIRPVTRHTLGTISAQLSGMIYSLGRIRGTMTGAEALAFDALIHLSAYQDTLDRTRTFCARCSDATELKTLDEMVRARDQLLIELRDMQLLWPRP